MKWLADECFDNDIIRGLLRQAPKFDLVRAQDFPEIAGRNDEILLAWAAKHAFTSAISGDHLILRDGYNDPTPKKIADVMGGAAVLGRRVRSIRELDKTVSEGLPKRALRLTAERVYPSAGDARRVMFRIVAPATFKRRTRLSVAQSERTERLARVIAAAEYAWNDRQDAREWLTKPHPELSRRSPLESAMSELGARRVEELLDLLFYGIPS